MMLSMTGYGKGSANDGKIFVDVEVKSVNSRYLDISLRLSSPLLDRETELREWIRNKIKRGKLSIVIGIKRNGIEEGISDIDEEKLKSYLSFIKKIKKVSKIDEKVKLEHLLYNKEIFLSKSEVFSETEFNLIKEALDNALSNLIKMEKNEGKELTKDLKKRIKIIEEKLDNIEKDRDAGIQEYFQKLKNRIKLLIKDEKLDENRFNQELAIIAEKADITEECVRLHSHNKFFIETIESDSEPGRKLNFLCQEMNRETNTISSKSFSISITHNAVLIKEEIEKLREQIQNIE